MFPFYQQQSSIKDYIDFYEFMQSKNKKDDKKTVPAPEPWTTADYLLWHLMFQSIFACALTVLVLHYSH